MCLQFTKDVVGQLESVKIDLRGIILLEAEGKQNLLDFSEAGLSEINYADYLEEVTHSLTYIQKQTNMPTHLKSRPNTEAQTGHPETEGHKIHKNTH